MLCASYTRQIIKDRNVHAVAKHDTSFREYVWLCELDKAKDLDVGQAYQNDKAGRAFVRHIAKVQQDRTVNLIDGASFFSLTMDGATDVSGTEQESVHIHFAHEVIKQQKCLQFVSPNSTSAEDIYNALVSTRCRRSQYQH